MAKKSSNHQTPGSPSSTTPSTVSALSLFTDGLPLPKLIIFDLDYTLWPFWVDTHVMPPLKAKDNNTRVIDRFSESFTFYPSVPPLLHAFHTAQIPLAIASRTTTPDLALQLLKLLHLPPPPPSHTTTTLSPPPSSSSPSISSSIPPTTSTSSFTFSFPLSRPSSPTPPPKPTNNPKSPRRALDFFAHHAIFPATKTVHMAKLQKASGVAYADMLFFDDEARNRVVEELGVTFWEVRAGMGWEELDRGVAEWRRRRR